MNKRLLYFFPTLICFVLLWSNSTLADEVFQTLRLYRIDWSNEGFKQFQQVHPEIKMEWTEIDYPSTEKLVSDMLLHEADCDLYHLSTIFIDEGIIADKGYLVDLSGSKIISQEIARMYPFVQQHAIRDGRIIGIPTDLSFQFMSICTDVWEEAGYTEEDIPHTFSEFLDFLDMFAERLADNPGLEFRTKSTFWDDTSYSDTSYIEWLVKLLFNEHVKQSLFAKQAVRFTDQELVNLMIRCKEVGNKLYLYESMNQGKGLFEETKSNVWPRNATLLSLPIHKGQPNLVTCIIDIDSISSFSQQKDTAIELLELLVSNIKNDTAIYFYPDAEPLIDNNYEDEKAHWQKKIVETKMKLEKKDIDVVARDELEIELKRYQDYLAGWEDRKYLVSEEQLRQYQSYVPYMYVYHPSKFSNATGVDWEVMQVLKRFAAGQTSAENALKELDQKAWMMEMEDQ